MQFDHLRMSPEPKKRSLCGLCEKGVIAKCGKVKIWHWAHEANGRQDCDEWYEPMSEWHLSWQASVPVEMREVKVEKHRADVLLPDGTVVEFQNSPIDGETVEERQNFYKKMIWVFNGIKLFGKLFRNEVTSKSGNEYVRFTYCRPRDMVQYLSFPVYIDYGDQVLEVNRNEEGNYFEQYEAEGEFKGNYYTTIRYKGWGHYLTKDEARDKIFGQWNIKNTI